MKRGMRALMVAALGAAFAAAPVFATGGDFQFTLGPGWKVPVRTFGETRIETAGDTITIINPTIGFETAEIMLAYQNLPAYEGGKAAPPMPKTLAGAAYWVFQHMDISMLGRIQFTDKTRLVVGKSRWYDQPALTYEGADVINTEPPKINIARALRNRGYPEEVIAEFKKRFPEGYRVPGKPYVTVVAHLDLDLGRFVVDRIVFDFEINWTALLRNVPQPKCPPGAAWPDCGAPPPPPGRCPEGTVGTPPDCRSAAGGFGPTDVRTRLRGFR